MNKRTKATSIQKDVKAIVHERDRGHCIFCYVAVGVECASAHVIPRSRGGLGVEENIITACPSCHHKLDQTLARKEMLVAAKAYLKKQYIHWDETKLVFQKGSDND